MTTDITFTPMSLEPLPPYRPRGAPDSDTFSIISSAPSYVSDAPTYTSRRPSIPSASPLTTPPAPQLSSSRASPPTRGLPAPRYAPGFQSRAHGSVADIESHSYNIAHWSSIRTSHAARQYHNVASRRARCAEQTAALLNSLAATPAPSLIRHDPAPSASGGSSNINNSSNVIHSFTHPAVAPVAESSAAASSSTPAGDATPASPLEDPALVGEEAAARARAQRLYREMCRRGDEGIRQESKSWDFMLSQMTDWEERDRSWKKFRSEVGRSKLLGRRIGLRR